MARENNKICRVFKALSEPKRYRIVTMLANGKINVRERNSQALQRHAADAVA